MNRFLPAMAVLLFHFSLQAHPGAGLAVDEQGRIFFTAGPMIVLIETNGAARTIVHDKKNERFYQLHHLQRTPKGSWVTASDTGTGLWEFSLEGKLSRFYPPPNGDRSLLIGLGGDPFAVDKEGNVYAVNSAQNRFTQIVKVSPEGRITVLAGGDWGFADGRGPDAKFRNLHSSGMLILPNGMLLLTDHGCVVRQVAPDGTVTTLAGSRDPGDTDGLGASARFAGARGLAVDENGDVLVADDGGLEATGGRIRKISPQGAVTTFAGSKKNRSIDGPVMDASFAGPTALAIAPNGDVLVLEPEGPRVRRISGGRVTTLIKRLP